MTNLVSHVKIGLRLAMALPLLVVTTALRADDGHSYLLVNADVKTGVAFADSNAHRAPDGFVTFSILTVPVTGSTAYSISRISINCASNEIATTEVVNYSARNAATPVAGDTAAKPVTPNTFGDVLKKFVCEGVDPFPRSKAVNDTEAAIAKGHDLIQALEKNQTIN